MIKSVALKAGVSHAGSFVLWQMVDFRMGLKPLCFKQAGVTDGFFKSDREIRLTTVDEFNLDRHIEDEGF